ncbi:MAG: DEAD/DEAH box helicase, partial [Actinomycetota bacterium]|nr:DEAD/DEAH box helicase [Actinomycetota bacterium]
VLSPNTAIQGQWVRGWQQLQTADGRNDVAVGTDRDLSAPVTALTYQSLAVFDDEPGEETEPTSSHLDRLHPNGQALVRRLQAAGPITLVLDECHHLLEVWGRLLAELLELLPEATVLGLTATPPVTLTPDQATLVADMFGEVVYTASIPAVVREGHLAPFADLVWLTAPTPVEAGWLLDQNQRFAELTTQLLDPAFGSVPFLTWVDRRFAGEVRFARIAAKQPLLADAALRMRYAGLLRLEDDVPTGERHHHAPTADDWALLIDDWYDACLAHSVDDRDQDVRDALRRSLPAVGYQLTRRGMRKGRSSVDRVLARSESKARAMVEIIAAEHRTLGDRLSMLVICDHEAASATVGIDLRGVLTERAGSARLALAHLLADPATAGLSPVMVTGRTVAAAPDVLDRLRSRSDVDLVVGEPDADGISELTGTAGAWTSREWVRAVTDFFTTGDTKVLIGTRALLGEGWDAPTASGLIDLSMASTPGTVVQTRGRTLRLDPRDPAKVAINWTVCCVADDHPKGDNDWERTVAKHRGYFGVDGSGDVVDGVAHVHPSFSPYTPPPARTFDATNAEMLVRAERRADIAASWRVGLPYEDEVRLSVWVQPGRGRAPAVVPQARPVPRPPDTVLTADGVRRGRARPAVGPWLLLALAALALLLAEGPGPAWPWLVAAVAATGAALVAHGRRTRAVLVELRHEPDAVLLAYALADGLHRAGLTAVGVEAVEWHVADDGRLRILLDTGGREERDSAVFAEALAELLAPIAQPRYLVPRYLVGTPGPVDLLRPLAAYRPEGVVWHPVPSVLGTKAELAQAFAAGWQTWVGGGPAVYTGNPEGAGALAASRGTNPLDATSVLRLSWS